MQHPPVDPPQPQQVQQDGQQHNKEADEEQIMVVNEGEAAPMGMVDTEVLLLNIPRKGESTARLSPQFRYVMYTFKRRCLHSMLPGVKTQRVPSKISPFTEDHHHTTTPCSVTCAAFPSSSSWLLLQYFPHLHLPPLLPTVITSCLLSN